MFASWLREVFDHLAARGLAQRDISRELGAGFSNPQLSRMARGEKIPTPEQLRKILLLAEVTVGKRLPASVREHLEAANLAALEAMKSPVLSMVTAHDKARQFQRQAEESQAREAVAERDLARARSALKDLRAELRRAKARESRIAGTAFDRLVEASARHEMQSKAVQRELAEQRAVVVELERHIGQLIAQVEQYQDRVRRYQVELAQSLHAFAAEAVRAEEAERAALEDRRQREEMGEEVAVLSDLLRQAQAELADLKQEHAQGLARADVLAEAEAVVERAKQASQPQSVGPGPAGFGFDSAAESTTVSPDQTAVGQARRAGSSAAPAEVVARLRKLVDAGEQRATDALVEAVSERDVEMVVATLDALGDAGFYREREQLTRACAGRTPESVVALLRALDAAEAASEAGWLVDEAARTSTDAVKRTVTLLLEYKERAYARRLLDAAVPRGSIADVVALVEILEQSWPGEAERLVRKTVAQRRTRDVVTMLGRLRPVAAEGALDALAERPASALAKVVGQLSSRGEQGLGARLADRAAGRAVVEVAELARLLAAGVEAEWLLDAFVQQRREEVLPLLHCLVEQGGHEPALALMRRVGGGGDPAQVEEAVQYAQLHRLSHEPVLCGAVARHPEEVWTLLAVLAHRNADLADQLIAQVMADLRVDEAADILERCLESGLGEVDITAAAAGADCSLGHVLQVAGSLRERGWLEDAANMLRAVGRSSAHCPEAFVGALRDGLATWALASVLTGITDRAPADCHTMISDFAAHGLDGYVRLMLEQGPEPERIPPLVDQLADAGLQEYVSALHSRLVRTLSPQQLAVAFQQTSSTAAGELAALASTQPAPYVGELVSWLARLECGRDILALLSSVSRGSALRSRELAALLGAAGRSRQSGWLAQQADAMRQPRPGLPPAEFLSEAAGAARRLFADHQLDSCLSVLDSAVTLDQISPGDLAGHLDDDLLGYFLDHRLVQDASPSSSALCPADPDIASVYLERLAGQSELRSRVIELAARHTPPQQCSALFDVLARHASSDEENLAYTYAAQRPPHEVTEIAEVLTGPESNRARLLLRAAFQYHPADGLPLLFPAARTHHVIGTPEDLTEVLTQRASDAAAVSAIQAAFAPEFEKPSDHPAGYYLRDPSHASACYWDGRAWTEDRMPTSDPAQAQVMLSAQDQAINQAGQPSQKALLTQRLAAGYAYVLGPEHHRTLSTRLRHAHWLGEASRLAEARDACRHLIDDCTRHLGADHETTLLARHNHAELTGEAGQPAEAASLFQQLASHRGNLPDRDQRTALPASARHTLWQARGRDPKQAAHLLNEMIKKVTGAIAAAPSLAWPRIYRGELHLEAGSYPRAIADFTEVLRTDPGNTRCLAYRGEAYRRHGENDRAIADFTEALTRNPESAWVLAHRGESQRDANRPLSAIADFTAALSLRPTDAWALARRGEAHRSLNAFAEAIVDLTAALDLEPDDAWALEARGEAHRQIGNYDQAISDYTAVLAQDPDSTWALSHRGEAHRETGSYSKAIADFSAALARDPDDAWALGSRGEAHRQTGDYERAITDLTNALSLDPTLTWALDSRGQAYRQIGNVNQAITDYTEALTLDPHDYWLLVQRGVAYRETQNYAQARTDFQRAQTYASAADRHGLAFEMLLLETRTSGYGACQDRWCELLRTPAPTPAYDAARFFPLFKPLLLGPTTDIREAVRVFTAQEPDQDALTDLLHYLAELATINEAATERAELCAALILDRIPDAPPF
ncbi:tetratricopeptide repeat protein [Streptomyces rochei]